MNEENANRGADAVLYAGPLLAGSIESPELASSLALHLLACRLDGRWEVLNKPPGGVLRLHADNAGFFFCDEGHPKLFQEGRRNLKR